MVKTFTSKAVVTGFPQRQRLVAVIASSILSINTEVMFLRTNLIFSSAESKQSQTKRLLIGFVFFSFYYYWFRNTYVRFMFISVGVLFLLSSSLAT